jgi:hypothetical protein
MARFLADRGFYLSDEALGELAKLAPVATEQLHTFLNAAAGEGLVLDSVDAGDLYAAMFPERYKAACESIEIPTCSTGTPT